MFLCVFPSVQTFSLMGICCWHRKEGRRVMEVRWVFKGLRWECWMEVPGGQAVETGLTKQEALWRLRRGRFGSLVPDSVMLDFREATGEGHGDWSGAGQVGAVRLAGSR